MKKSVLFFLIGILFISCKQSITDADVNKINGYWEIEKVILKDGEKPNEKLKNSFYKSILPLLQEYFFGDFGKIGLVLGQGFVNLKNWDDKVDSFAEFDHESSGDFESKDVYEIIDYREPTNYEVNKVKMDFEKAIKRLMKLNIA